MRRGCLYHHVSRLCYTGVQFHFLAFWKESLETAVVISSEDTSINMAYYRGGDKSLARPGRKQATAREGFEFYISYL